MELQLSDVVGRQVPELLDHVHLKIIRLANDRSVAVNEQYFLHTIHLCTFDKSFQSRDQPVVLLGSSNRYSQAACTKLNVTPISDHDLLLHKKRIDRFGVGRPDENKVGVGRIDLGNEVEACKGGDDG